MKRFLLVAAAIVISTSAFAQAGGPVRQGNKCWVLTDARGFGFWDQCADQKELDRENKGHRGMFDRAVTSSTGVGVGGDGGGGGGGGGR
jgi:hypothetical protein